MDLIKRNRGRDYNELWHITCGDFETICQCEDHSEEIVKATKNAILRGLYKIGLKAERYAKQNAHVITGRLRNSITFDIDPDEKAVMIGTNVEYAPYEEEGTSKRSAHPFLRPAAQEHIAEYAKILKDELQNGG